MVGLVEASVAEGSGFRIDGVRIAGISPLLVASHSRLHQSSPLPPVAVASISRRHSMPRTTASPTNRSSQSHLQQSRLSQPHFPTVLPFTIAPPHQFRLSQPRLPSPPPTTSYHRASYQRWPPPTIKKTAKPNRTEGGGVLAVEVEVEELWAKAEERDEAGKRTGSGIGRRGRREWRRKRDPTVEIWSWRAGHWVVGLEGISKRDRSVDDEGEGDDGGGDGEDS
ncbi:hypothetical protein Scep_001151 [Stephania cephalantha]|uniref:Uncharacterized protein n=1 Tax=Stephania cephalantha TaxID=152367 RepID=A0AAP0LA65_9MAGN